MLFLKGSVGWKIRLLAVACVAPVFLGSSLAIAAPVEPTDNNLLIGANTAGNADQDEQTTDLEVLPQSGDDSIDAEEAERFPEEEVLETGDVADESVTGTLPSPSESDEVATQASKDTSPRASKQLGCGIPSGSYKGKISGEKRLGGKDRYQTNVAIAKAVSASANGAGRTVFVANGLDYADGLALGALASQAGWPLFLVNKNSINQNVAAQIKAIKPTRIIIAGGTGVVSSKVQNELVNMGTPEVTATRLAGEDRYATSAKIAECFPQGSPAFVVTGANFADAVVAGPAAASTNGAVILTRTGKADSYAKRALSSLKPNRIHIVGGTWPNSTQSALKNAAGGQAAIKVYKGSDRYQTSAVVADSFFGNSKSVVYANGSTFPDSLSGVSAAKVVNAPILLTRAKCRPANIGAVANKRTGTRVILGGTGVVTKNSYTSTCTAPKPKPAPSKTVISVAKSLVGSKAAQGSAANNPSYGFDCSGFTQYVHAQVGKKIPRSSGAQWSAGKNVSNPQPGDVVVMSGGGHVGIYAGNGMLIDSPGYFGTTVKYRGIWGPVNAYVRF